MTPEEYAEEDLWSRMRLLKKFNRYYKEKMSWDRFLDMFVTEKKYKEIEEEHQKEQEEEHYDE